MRRLWLSCTLSRRALRTGKAVWTRPTSDVGTIRASDIGPLATDHGVSKTLVQAKGHSDVDRCRQQMVGYQVSTGKRRWQRDVFSCPYRGGGQDEFGKLLGVDQATMLATDAEGRPMAVDLDTGKPRWTGSSPAQPIDAGSRWVLARASTESGAISGWDAETGKRPWQLPDPETLQTSAVLDDVVLLELGLYGLLVLTAKTGTERFRLEDARMIGAGSTWLVAGHGSRVGFYELGG